MAKDINNNEFDDATKLKLEIFGDCFEEWLPVFIHHPYVEHIYIYDFFAGSGMDIKGNSGSPLILLNKAKGRDRKFCIKASKNISFIFNESITRKSKLLKENVDSYLLKCKIDHNCDSCKYKYFVKNSEFKDIFNDEEIMKIFNNNKVGKFVLLDQYGFSEIDEGIFKKLVSFPKTDFIFFISSSFISRFRNHPNTTKSIDTSSMNFEDSRPNEIHREVAKHFRGLIPDEKEYYLHHFSIRKDPKKGNYYGLIFGTNHTLGMEKFLKVCWNKDPFSGEANYNIDNNFENNTLFGDCGKNVKKDIVAEEIKKMILSGEISDNIKGLKFTLANGCEPKLFTETVKILEKEGKIIRDDSKNNSYTSIHKVKKYFIKRLDNET